MRSRLVAASAITLAAALAGCSGSGSDGATSADASGKDGSAAPTSKEAAPSSKAPAPKSSTSSAPSTSSASESPSSSSSSSVAAPGKTVNQAQVVEMAKKVGCTNPAFRKIEASAPAAKAGTKGGVNCVSGAKGYIITLVTPGTGPKATAMSLKKAAKNAPVPYLYGDNWALFAVANSKAKSATFDKSIIEDAKRKIGAGEIATA